MALTLSPPVRIAALVGLVAALGGAVLFMLMGRGGGSVATPPVHIVHHPFGPGAARKTHAGAAPTTAAPAKTSRKRHAAAAASTGAKPGQAARKAREQSAAVTAALNAGLPVGLARALGRHAVVVVELTDPQSEVDGISYAEARAGAAEAGVGFVALNVLSQADVGKLTSQFGQVLPDPGLLVYKRPGTLVVRIDGFVDKDTVAQAAHNASTGS